MQSSEEEKRKRDEEVRLQAQLGKLNTWTVLRSPTQQFSLERNSQIADLLAEAEAECPVWSTLSPTADVAAEARSPREALESLATSSD